MKKFNFFVCISILIMLSVSCSKDDPVMPDEEKATATLSFNAVLNDLVNGRAANKQVSVPECSDAAPAYVGVVLSGTTAVGTMEEPLFVDLISNSGRYFTMESPELELVPGTYSLDFFAVYDADDNIIWLAPMQGSEFGNIALSLPLGFDLGAGVKKYLDVDVLCYDDRLVNMYGYLFFDLHPTRAIEFCLFGNICDDNGRHAPANFRFDVWVYSGFPANPKGFQLFDQADPFFNNVGINEDGDAFANPLCIFLPDTRSDDEFYGEIYLLDNGNSRLIRSGVFTENEIKALFDGPENLEYYHFREGECNMEDQPILLDLPGEVVCTEVNFEDIGSPENFTSDFYINQGVEILAGPDYPGNAMKIMAGTCSENTLHSLNYPFASVLLNFPNEVYLVNLVAGDYGEDEDTMILTAYSGPNGTGDVIATETRILREGQNECLNFNLQAEGIRSVILFGQSSSGEGHNNTIFTDNISFCRRL